VHRRLLGELGFDPFVVLTPAQPTAGGAVPGTAVLAGRPAGHLLDHHLAPGQSALTDRHGPHFFHSHRSPRH
jgi:hypothetical protein